MSAEVGKAPDARRDAGTAAGRGTGPAADSGARSEETSAGGSGRESSESAAGIGPGAGSSAGRKPAAAPAVAGGRGPAEGQRSAASDAASVEGRLKRLDDIVSLLQSGGQGLDESLALFEEGVEHVRITEEALAKAELRVEELIASGRTR